MRRVLPVLLSALVVLAPLTGSSSAVAAAPAVSVAARPNPVVVGGVVSITGAIRPARPGAPVVLETLANGRWSPTRGVSGRLNARSQYVLRVRLPKVGRYTFRVVGPKSGRSPRVASGPFRVNSRLQPVTVLASLSSASADQGTPVTITASTNPSRAGAVARVDELVEGAWVSRGSRTLDARSTMTTAGLRPTPGTHVYRVVVAPSSRHATGSSGRLTLTVRSRATTPEPTAGPTAAPTTAPPTTAPPTTAAPTTAPPTAGATVSPTASPTVSPTASPTMSPTMSPTPSPAAPAPAPEPAPEFGTAGAPLLQIEATSTGKGYWVLVDDGGVFDFGDAPFLGSRAGQPGGDLVVALEPKADDKGMWLLRSDGAVHAYGTAVHHGDHVGQPRNADFVAMAAHPSGSGYWLVGRDGGIFAYKVPFHGGLGGTTLTAPIVDIVETPSGGGYWLVGADGRVYPFGDAKFFNDMKGQPLNKPVVGMAASSTGGGYWLLGGDGGLFTFGDATFSTPQGSTSPYVSIARARGTDGFWTLEANGNVRSHGTAGYYGEATFG